MSRQSLWLLSLAAVASAAQANNSIVAINDPFIPITNTSSYYVNSGLNLPETHVISVYESRADHGDGYHPAGQSFVHVTGSADSPVNLVLSSAEPTEWVIDGRGAEYLSSVYVNDFFYPGQSAVTGIDASKVHVVKIAACAYGWPQTDGGCDTQALVGAVESMTGGAISTFTGYYRANDFTVYLAAAVPEPQTASLFGLGLLGMAGVALKRSRRRA